MKFQKGQSGNPAGRKPGTGWALLSKAVREITDERQISAFMLDVMKGKIKEARPADRVKAAEWLSDHGYGKVPETIHLGGEEDGAPIRQQDVKPLVSDEAALRILRPTEPPANAV